MLHLSLDLCQEGGEELIARHVRLIPVFDGTAQLLLVMLQCSLVTPVTLVTHVACFFCPFLCLMYVVQIHSVVRGVQRADKCIRKIPP